MPRARSWSIAVALIAVQGVAFQPVPAMADDLGAVAACKISKLPVPAGTEYSAVLAGDSSGRWLGGWYSDGDDTTVTRWRDGKRRDLEPPVRGFSIEGINSRGDVVGIALVGSTYRAYASRGGEFVELTSPGADYVFANDLNSDGLVTGGIVEDGVTSAAVWKTSAPDDPKVLPVQPPYEGEGVGIDERGETAVVGWPPVDDDFRSYVVDRDGHRQRLRGTEPGWAPWIQAIEDGWAVGFERDATLQQRIIRWDLDRPRQPRAFTSAMFAMHAVNAEGVIGGTLRDAEERFVPGLITGTKTTQLPGLGTALEGEVRTVGNNGQAAGAAADLDGSSNAVTWTC